MSKVQTEAARRNRFLGALEAASLERIRPHLQPIELKLGAIVCEAGGLLKHAYFPQGSVLSLLTRDMSRWTHRLSLPSRTKWSLPTAMRRWLPAEVPPATVSVDSKTCLAPSNAPLPDTD